ncbi:MAG: reverse transcriptase/maturase family protein, partial [bacterium]|nr:reverse transcriptase/maturase family protein [bacterium]
AWHHEISARCFHVAGRGGGKGAIREVQDHLSKNQFVFRSDVKGYYASIQHDFLMQQLRENIDDERLLQVLEGYVRRTVCDGGIYREMECGIPLGCSLSPLMGALFLSAMDEEMEQSGLFYARFMDDWVVLAKTRWHLRRAIRKVNAILEKLQLQQHPDKTFIGYVRAGFDFLGYHFSLNRLCVAQKTFEQFTKKVDRLYEQTASSLCREEAVVNYVRRWMRWVRSGLEWITRCFGDDVAVETRRGSQSQGSSGPMMMALERSRRCLQ